MVMFCVLCCVVWFSIITWKIIYFLSVMNFIFLLPRFLEYAASRWCTAAVPTWPAVSARCACPGAAASARGRSAAAIGYAEKV